MGLLSEDLLRFGYTEREAAFLRPAALLSGCFLRQQFNAFIDRECGALGQRFIERACGLGHVTARPGIAGRMLYEVSGSRLYAELGDERNRNRRRHRPATVRRRLMALDYLISKKGEAWLLTDREKRESFARLGVEDATLPSVVFSGHRSFFPDKQPISFAEDGTPVLGFIDEGLSSLARWTNFLRANRPLLQALKRARVVFASFQPARFREAETLLRVTVCGEGSSGEVDLARLRSFFTSRHLAESGRYESFDQSRLDELRENRRVYTGPEYDSLYKRWLAGGDSVLRFPAGLDLQFEAVLLPNFYEWLSPIRTH